MVLTLLPYKFGVANDAKIRQLNYWYAVRLQIFLWMCRFYLGLEPLIRSGLRTAAEQDALHASDHRNPPASKSSSHMAGKATDISFARNGIAVLLKDTPPAKWQPVYNLAAICGILNGSRFNGYPDNNHFYIT